MVARGAQASDAQVKLIVEYLAKTLGRASPALRSYEIFEHLPAGRDSSRSLASLAQQPAPDPLLRWMDQIAQQQLQKRKTPLPKSTVSRTRTAGSSGSAKPFISDRRFARL